MEKLLDFSVPLDVGLLDKVMEVMYQGTNDKEVTCAVISLLSHISSGWRLIKFCFNLKNTLTCGGELIQFLSIRRVRPRR